jgi:hypothetical protein
MAARWKLRARDDTLYAVAEGGGLDPHTRKGCPRPLTAGPLHVASPSVLEARGVLLTEFPLVFPQGHVPCSLGRVTGRAQALLIHRLLSRLRRTSTLMR